MWLGKSKRRSATLWLDGRQIALLDGDDAPIRRESVSDCEEGVRTLEAWIRPLRGAKLRLWLGGDVCRLVRVPAMRGARDAAEAQAAADLWLREQGVADEGWVFRLAESAPDLEHWRGTLTRRELMNAGARSLHRRLLAMRPWWAWALASLAESVAGASDGGGGGGGGSASTVPAGLFAYDGNALTVLVRDVEGDTSLAETIAPIADMAAARRLLLRRGLTTDAAGRYLDWTQVAKRQEPGARAMADRDFAFEPWVRRAESI